MKKIFTLIVLCVFCLNAINAEITWTLSNDGTLTISGTDMPDYPYNQGPPWYLQCTVIKKVIIKNGVTNIGSYAFCNCQNLTSVTIPNSVTRIGDVAFYFCYSLTSVTIPKSVTSIGERAFMNCSNLTSVTIPNSVTSIGDNAFNGCTQFSSITIPNSVTSIGNHVFMGCSLTSITVGKENKTYDSRNDCNAIIETKSNALIVGSKNTIIPNSVTSIRDRAFEDTEITSVIIPNSVTSIEGSAFYGCKKLASITIPNSVTSIGADAFSGGEGGMSLASIIVEKGNPYYDSRNDCNAIIETKSNTLIKGCMNTLIPNSVTSIGERAFCGSYGLTSIIIPNSVTSIGDRAFAYSDIASITISNSLTDIKTGTFYCCNNLVSIDIPESVITIGEDAFRECRSLTSVVIPNSVTSIGKSAFSYCKKLSKIICYATTPPSVDEKAFNETQCKSGILYVPESALSTYLNYIPLLGKIGGWNGWKNIKPIKEPASISLENASEKLVVGQTKTLKATITPMDVMDNTITWSTSNPDIATVSARGIVTAKSAGTAVITAKTCNGLTAECTISIINVPVSSVALNVSTASLWVGETMSLTATTNPTTADNTAVEWFSINTDVATVSAEGIVTAKGKGSCTIYCTAADGYGASSTCSVTVKQQVTAITLSDADVSLWVGDTKSLTAKITPLTVRGTKLEWSSSDTNVATVSSNGVVTAKGKGTCTITCAAADGYGTKSTCSVTVKQSVTAIALNVTNISLLVDETKKITATVSPSTADNTAIEWSSSNANVATVSSEGIVTAKGKGTCTITCSAVDGYGTKSTCSVTVKQPVMAITLSAAKANLWVGTTKTITATITPATADNMEVIWTSSDTKVATVSSNGAIKAVGKGFTTITCVAADGYGTKSMCLVTVKQPVTAIALSDASTSLWVGETKTITATVTPTSASDTAVKWSSSDTKVAIISSDGTITAIGTGSCTITCTAADGYGTKSTCKVTVKQQVNSIDFENETLTITCGTEKILNPTITPSNADVQTLAWKSTDKNIAEITSKGVLKAVSPGTATITCTSTDGFNKQGSIKVNVVSFDITDDKPNIADGTYGTGGITYTRAMKKDKCDVFCMPYDIDLSEYTDFFNKVYVLNGMAIHKSNGKVLIPLKEVTFTETISAGQPFVAYAATSGQVVLKNSSKVTIASLEEPQAIKLDVYDYSGNSVTYNPNIDMTITGNYAKRTGLDKANTFVFSTSGLMSKATTVSPYRFYFTKNDERSSAKITDIQLSFDEDVTGIEELTITNDNKFIYNLKGQRINRADVQKGVYIINGKKKVIK